MNFTESKRVLIVEDDSLTLKILNKTFQKEGYIVTEALTGNDAINLLEELSPHAVILDYSLPDTTGFEVLKYIKNNPKHSKTAVIILTGNDDEIDTVLCLEMGADDYILKPYKPRELLVRVRNILRMYDYIKTSENSIIAFHNIEIDLTSRLVKKDGKILEMTLKEFDLLALLASNPQMVFTREKLLDRVWGHDALLGSRTVDVHISMLRKKIESENIKFIETVKGLGYRFRF
jgi:DNA-binding response OmpR family regulator